MSYVEANLYILGLVLTASVMGLTVVGSFIAMGIITYNKYKTHKKEKRLKRFKIIKGEKKEIWFDE